MLLLICLESCSCLFKLIVAYTIASSIMHTILLNTLLANKQFIAVVAKKQRRETKSKNPRFNLIHTTQVHTPPRVSATPQRALPTYSSSYVLHTHKRGTLIMKKLFAH
jgi:hypothetical protein